MNKEQKKYYKGVNSFLNFKIYIVGGWIKNRNSTNFNSSFRRS